MSNAAKGKTPTQDEIRAEYLSHADAEARQFVHGAIRDWRERHRPEPEFVGVEGKYAMHTADEPCPVEAPKDDYEQTRLRWPVRQLTQREPEFKWSHPALGVWTLPSPSWDPHWLFDFWGKKPPNYAMRLWAAYAQVRLLTVEPLDYYEAEPTQTFPCHEDDDDTRAHYSRLFHTPKGLLVGHGGQTIQPTYLGFDTRSSDGGMPAWMRPCARFLTDANRVSHDYAPTKNGPPEYSLLDEDYYESEQTDFTSDTRYWLFTPWAVAPFPTLEGAQAAAGAALFEIASLSFLSKDKPLINAHLPAVPKDLFGEFPCPVCRAHLEANADRYQEHYERVVSLWHTLKLLSVAEHQAAGLQPITDRVKPYRTRVTNTEPIAYKPPQPPAKPKRTRKPKAGL